MNKQEILAYIDKRLVDYQKELEQEPDDGIKMDLISDYIVFEIEEEIAKYAISLGYQATIEGFSLEELIYTKDLEYEDGADVPTSELINNWITTIDGSIEYSSVQQKIPNKDVLDVVLYYSNKMNKNFSSF